MHNWVDSSKEHTPEVLAFLDRQRDPQTAEGEKALVAAAAEWLTDEADPALVETLLVELFAAVDWNLASFRPDLLEVALKAIRESPRYDPRRSESYAIGIRCMTGEYGED